MIDADTFVAADPREIAADLDGAIHLWHLPWRRDHGRTPLLGLLAAYLHVAPSMLVLEEDAHGKPYLSGAHALRFNWSHSGHHAVVALTRDIELGVDIEQAREGVHVLELAQRFFAPAEARELAACDEAERDQLFLQLWCAKEAVLKALGRGLAFGLGRVEFARAPNGWQPVRFDAAAGAAADWQVLRLCLGPDCPGSLAWCGAPRPVLACATA